MENISVQEPGAKLNQAYRELMWRKLKVVFILLFSLAQSIKWHFQWITSLDLTFPSFHLFTPRTVRAFYLVLLFSYPSGFLPSALLSLSIGAAWRHLAARGFSTRGWRCATPTVDAWIYAMFSVI